MISRIRPTHPMTTDTVSSVIGKLHTVRNIIDAQKIATQIMPMTMSWTIIGVNKMMRMNTIPKNAILVMN